MVIFILRSIRHHIVGFFSDWYVRSFYFIFSGAFRFLGSLERYVALKVTIRYWLQPLYQDYTFIGYLLGLPFRTFRIIVGIIIYPLVLSVFAVFYILWALLPPWLVLKIV